jgi:hypothetical protein
MEVFLREVKELVEKMARDLLDGKPAIILKVYLSFICRRGS